jgi:hypothetical protein
MKDKDKAVDVAQIADSMKSRVADQVAVADGWLGFDSRSGRLLAGEVTRTGDVMPGGYVAIVSRPQVPFRGERLCVHMPIASSFLIHSLRAGTREMTAAATSPIPADAFMTRMDALAEIDAMFARDQVIEVKVGKSGAELLGSPWTLPLVDGGIDIILSVENIGDRPLRFIAGMLGKVHPATLR